MRNLAELIGEEEFSESDKKYLAFGKAFEEKFVSQGIDEARDRIASLNLGWEILGLLPKNELTQVSEEEIKKYYPGDDQKNGG